MIAPIDSDDFAKSGFARYRPAGDETYGQCIREAAKIAENFAVNAPKQIGRKWAHATGRPKHLVNIHHHSATFARILTSAPVREIVRSLRDEVPMYFTHTKISYKHHGIQQAWLDHQDSAYKSRGESNNILTLGIFLEPCNDENGTLGFVEGSHLLGRLPHEMVMLDGEAEPQLRLRSPVSGARLTAPGQTGDIVAFDGHTVHFSGTNCLGGHRAIFLCELSPYRAGATEAGGRTPIILSDERHPIQATRPPVPQRAAEWIVEYGVMPVAKRSLRLSSRLFNYPRRLSL